MTAPELFEGFADRQAQLEDDLVTEHGEGVRELPLMCRQYRAADNPSETLLASSRSVVNSSR